MRKIPNLASLLFLTSAVIFGSHPRLAHAGKLTPLKLDELHQAAPDFELQSLDEGKKASLTALISGRPVILHVWASWCTSCEIELPQLALISEKWVKDGLQFLAVSVDQPENKKKLIQFVSRLPKKIPLWMATHPDQAQSYWSWGLPMTYFINSKGIIVARAMGARDWSKVPEDELRKVLQRP